MRCAPLPMSTKILAVAAMVVGLLTGPVVTAPVVPVGAPDTDLHGSDERPERTVGARTRTVTLLTGDRVVFASPRQGSRGGVSPGKVSPREVSAGEGAGEVVPGEVVPGAGRSGMTFVTRRFAGALHVIPADALPLVTSGAVDARLFDLTTLAAVGAADGPRLLVTYRDSALRPRLTGDGADLWAAVRPLDGGTRLRGGVRRISLDDGSDRGHARHRSPGTGPTSGTGSTSGAEPTSSLDPPRGARRTPHDAGQRAETHELTITHLDRDGRPTDRFGDLIFALDDDRLEFPMGEGSTTRLRLPEGRYHLEATVLSGSGDAPDFHTVVQPLIDLDRDLSVTIDARTTRPVTVDPPRPGARLALVDLAYRRYGANRARVLESGFVSHRLDDTYTAHQGPDVGPDELVDRLHTQWARPDGHGGYADTPYVYGLYWLTRGRYLTGFTGAAHPDDLATVRSRHVAQSLTATEVQRSFAPSALDAGGIGGWSVGIPFTTPSTVTAHLMAGGVRWSGSLAHTTGTGKSQSELTWLSSPPRAYTAGQTYAERWNAAVLGPALPAAPPDYPAAVARHANRIVVTVPMYSDQAGHLGGSQTDRASTILYRGRGQDRIRVGVTDAVCSGEFVVPSRQQTYTLVTSATRRGFADLSTRMEASFTFQSSRAPRSGKVLPISVARFAPPVDARNRVPGAGPTLVPVTVQTQLGKPRLTVRTLTVQASTDDGRTWTPVRLLRRPHDERAAVVPRPSRSAYVSLRASVVDIHGNRSQQTIIRAYAVR